MTVMIMVDGRLMSGFEVWCGFERALVRAVHEAVGEEWYAERERREVEFRAMWEGMTDEERADWVLGGGV